MKPRKVKFPGGRVVVFRREKATAATQRKRLAALRKARAALCKPKKRRR